jgi:hypothetical protein
MQRLKLSSRVLLCSWLWHLLSSGVGTANKWRRINEGTAIVNHPSDIYMKKSIQIYYRTSDRFKCFIRVSKLISLCQTSRLFFVAPQTSLGRRPAPSRGALASFSVSRYQWVPCPLCSAAAPMWTHLQCNRPTDQVVRSTIFLLRCPYAINRIG